VEANHRIVKRVGRGSNRAAPARALAAHHSKGRLQRYARGLLRCFIGVCDPASLPLMLRVRSARGRLTVDLRSTHARDRINKALTRNQQEAREAKKRGEEVPYGPPSASGPLPGMAAPAGVSGGAEIEHNAALSKAKGPQRKRPKGKAGGGRTGIEEDVPDEAAAGGMYAHLAGAADDGAAQAAKADTSKLAPSEEGATEMAGTSTRRPTAESAVEPSQDGSSAAQAQPTKATVEQVESKSCFCC
jgi:hypothetical protein